MRPRICFVVASPLTAQVFLLRHIVALADTYDVTVTANSRDFAFLECCPPDRVVGIDNRLERRISLWRDVRSLGILIWLFHRTRFAAVHSVTSKAGLVAMLAAALVRVPRRIHTFTGQAWSTESGLYRRFLKTLDQLTAMLATNVLVDSPSQREFLIKERILPAEKAIVLGEGSISGVDTNVFVPDPDSRKQVRETLGIDQLATVFLFLARITQEKGVLDLAHAFTALCSERTNVYLLIVGPDEDLLVPKIREICQPCAERLTIVDSFVNAYQPFIAASDVLCLPSYKEGFGSIVIDAAAVGVPAIGSRIYGLVDAIAEQRTGLLHQPGDISALCDLMRKLTDDPELRQRMGLNARERALQSFSAQQSTAHLVDFYRQLC